MYSVSNVSAETHVQVTRPSEDLCLQQQQRGRNPRQHLPTDTPPPTPAAEGGAGPPPTPPTDTLGGRQRWPLGCGRPVYEVGCGTPVSSPWRRAGRKEPGPSQWSLKSQCLFKDH